MKIEIGGGTIPAAGFVNLDPIHGVGEFKRRIQDGIPVPDDSVEAARASHVMEHILAGSERINAMNEVHRVLQPGGEFEIIVPCIMASGVPVQTWHAWADPDHKSYWVLPESWHYFTTLFQPNANYGIRLWQLLAEDDFELRGGWEARVVMRKPL